MLRPRCTDNEDKANEKVTTHIKLKAYSPRCLRDHCVKEIRCESSRCRSRSAFAMFFSSLLIVTVAVTRVTCFEHSWFTQRKIGIDPGPAVIATHGEVWPRPYTKITKDEFFIVRSNFFQFKVTGKTCDVLERALQRYKQDLRAHEKTRRIAKMFDRNKARRRNLIIDQNFKGYLDEISVNLERPCENTPHEDMDEHYELRINTEDFPKAAFLTSQSIWGILRGLETWSQLIYSSPDNNAMMINSTSIMDFPRFSHRGLLIDTSRHFLPLRTIYSMLDAMAMSKLNVLHWHIVDDQSFPFQSQTFPNLSAMGSYTSSHVYSPADVQLVIAYAKDRGIRVIPEFDTPGHTRSWGLGYPELLTKCYAHGKPDGSLGPMNPIEPGTYNFMRKMLKEIKETFSDSFVHLGGDEVEFECWESNPQIVEYMNSHGWTPRKLEEMYITQIIEMATNLSLTSAVWQEVFDNGAAIPNNTIIHIWKSDHRKELFDVTRKGYKALLSSCWYLDAINSGGDWHKFYKCDPYDFPGDDNQKRLIIGGEACMWGEVVDVNNILSRVWPRACATAEKLWSSDTANINEAARRLEEHTCRMNRRKIPAQPPNGPGYCPGVGFA